MSSKKKIRIVFITPGLGMGGAEMMLFNLLNNMDKDRFEPVVISLDKKNVLGHKFEESGIPFHIMNWQPSSPNPLSLWELNRLVRKIKPDILQGWMYHGNIVAQVLGFLSGGKIPVLWSIHHTINELKKEKLRTRCVIWLGKWLSRFPVKIHYVSDNSALMHEAYGFIGKNSITLSGGFDVQCFRFSPEARQRVREELGVASDALLVGSLARYHPVKDHSNFIRAAGILAEKRSNVHYLLAGKDVDESNLELTQLRDSLNLKGRMHFLGLRSDVSKLLAACDIVVSHSISESFPLVVGEAMACEVPCVVTDVGGSAYMIGETGKKVPAKDSPALVLALDELLAMGAEPRRKMGQMARERVIQMFSLKSMTQKFESMYQEVLAG